MSDTDNKLLVTGSTEREGLNISLISMLMATIIVALILVSIAYFLYYISPERKFDLARPGNPNKNAVVDIEDIQSDSTSQVTVVDAKNKLDSFSKELKALSGYNSFDPAEINDQNIGLQPNDQPEL